MECKDNLKSTNLKSENITKQEDDKCEKHIDYEKIQKLNNNHIENKNIVNLANGNNKDDVNIINVITPNIENNHHKNFHSDSWSGILPSKIESGYNSESIQIFKIDNRNNSKDKGTLVDKKTHINEIELIHKNHIKNTFPIQPEIKKQNDADDHLHNTVKNSNFNHAVDKYKDNSFILRINDLNKTNLNQNIFTQTISDVNTRPINNSSIYLNQRISNIDQKIKNIQSRQKDHSNVMNNKNINLDSRILSENDMSELEESKILKRKSFLSLNN